MWIVRQGWHQMNCFKRTGSWQIPVRSVATLRLDVNSRHVSSKSSQSRMLTRIPSASLLHSLTSLRFSSKLQRQMPPRNQRSRKLFLKTAWLTTKTSSKRLHLHVCLRISPTYLLQTSLFPLSNKSSRCKCYSKTPQTRTQKESKSTKKLC